MIPLPPDYTRSRSPQAAHVDLSSRVLSPHRAPCAWRTSRCMCVRLLARVLERKQECRSLSGWLLASTQSPCNGASGIRQPRTTGSSRLCMTRWQKSPSSTPARSVSASSLSGADDPKVLAARKRVTRLRPRQSQVVAVQPNAQQQQQAEAQRKAAQTVFSVHTRSELEALRLCHHMTL